MSNRNFRHFLILSLFLCVLSGCQSDVELDIAETAMTATVLVYQVNHDFDAKSIARDFETIQGFWYMDQKLEGRLRVVFTNAASDEYLKRRGKEILADLNVDFIQLNHEVCSKDDPNLPQIADVSERMTDRVRRSDHTGHQFPNVFDLFRFLF